MYAHNQRADFFFYPPSAINSTMISHLFSLRCTTVAFADRGVEPKRPRNVRDARTRSSSSRDANRGYCIIVLYCTVTRVWGRRGGGGDLTKSLSGVK